MRNLSDQLLIEAYDQASKLKLNNEFIGLLKIEMQKRNLNIHNHHVTSLYSSNTPQDYPHKDTISVSSISIERI